MAHILQTVLFLSFLFIATSDDYTLHARLKTVTLTHETGPGRWDGSKETDFYFTLVGTKAESEEQLCHANRDRGSAGTCTFEFDAKLGRLLRVKIRNAGDNLWAVVSIDVDINGRKRGTWDGFRKVMKFKTVSILVESIENEEFGELVFGPAQDSPVSCVAGNYALNGECVECGENTYSWEGSYACTECPEGMFSAAGSTDESDCEYELCSAGYYWTLAGCQRCWKNTYSEDGAFLCTDCPDGSFSKPGSTSLANCRYEVITTCDCWTPECGYCANPNCTIKQDLQNSDHGIEILVHSIVKWRRYSSIVLYDEHGRGIGKFQWNIGRLFLTGCVQCRTPPALRKAIVRKGETSWGLFMKDGVIEVSINGVTLYKQELVGECKEVYGKVKRFAFYDMGCSNKFSYVPGEMELGDKLTSTCSGRCNQ